LSTRDNPGHSAQALGCRGADEARGACRVRSGGRDGRGRDGAATARKIANIAANPRVALVVGWDDDVSVQVEGLEEFAIVRVTPRWLRYYDARPESFHVTEGNWPPPGEQGSPGRG
jgi:hypothetical protein